MAQNEFRNALQAMSNSAASTVSAPVDGIAWLLRKAGVPIPGNALMGSDWMAAQGLTAPVRPGASQIAGDTLGLLAPMGAAAKAPQIARGLLAVRDNALAPLPYTNRATSAKISSGLPTPDIALRIFSDDYVKTIGGLEGSRLTTSIDGVPLTAPIVAGRRTVGGMDEAAEASRILDAARVLGAPVRRVTAKEIGANTTGRYRPEYSASGRYQGRDIQYLDSLQADSAQRVVSHEFGHMLDDIIAGNVGISAKGTAKELDQVYNDLNKKGFNGGKLWNPEADGYKGADVAREKWAEAFRAYQENPNYIKTVAPNVAREIRKRVNTHPEISKVIQFNSLAGAGLLGASLIDQGRLD